MVTANPYATSRNGEEFAEPDYASLDSAFAVPGLDDDAPYNDEQGWAPTLRLSAQETPDAARLGSQPLRDFRPVPGRPPEEFYGKLDADEAKRHSVEDIDANGWTEHKGILASDRRWADDPRRTPPPENRVTQQMAPRTYFFTRPFMTGLPKMGARDLNGSHFSMADHRRKYEIGGMSAVRSGRNTYRIEPAPWDADIVDMPADVEPTIPQARIRSVEVDYRSRSWRLS